MAEQTLADPDEESEADAQDATPTPDTDETASDDGDYEMAMASQDDIGDPDGFFDGVDADPDTTGSTDANDFFDGQDSGDGADDSDSERSQPGPVAERANKSIGKIGVFGLEDGSKKDSLEDEFVELAETVGFGNFTERAMEKHLATTDFDDIDPVYGVIGAALILAAAIVYKRPDIETDDIKAKVSGSLGSLPMLNNDDE